jgi:hypothetical protein
MLEFVVASRVAGDRKLRLYACACARPLWPLLADERSRSAVAAAERYADGMASEAELAAVYAAAYEVHAATFPKVDFADRDARDAWFERHLEVLGANADAGHPALHAANAAAEEVGYAAFGSSPMPGDSAYLARSAECIPILTDIFGSWPFRPLPPLDSAWLAWNDGIVRRLAEAAYEHRSLPSGELATARLAVLGDALLDAGCTDAEILAHLRGLGPHVRGCSAVDLLTGKE